MGKGKDEEPKDSAAADVLKEAASAVGGPTLGKNGICWEFVNEVLRKAEALTFHDIEVLNAQGKRSLGPWGQETGDPKPGYIATFPRSQWKVETGAVSKSLYGDSKPHYGEEPWTARIPPEGHIGIVLENHPNYIIVAQQNMKREWNDEHNTNPGTLEVPRKKLVIFDVDRKCFRLTVQGSLKITYYIPIKNPTPSSSSSPQKTPGKSAPKKQTPSPGKTPSKAAAKKPTKK